MTGVTPNGIRYPDGASKAKNLGPELQQMAEDIDGYIVEHFDPNDPLFKSTAETAVDTAINAQLPPAIDDLTATIEPRLPRENDNVVWAVSDARRRHYLGVRDDGVGFAPMGMETAYAGVTHDNAGVLVGTFDPVRRRYYQDSIGPDGRLLQSTIDDIGNRLGIGGGTGTQLVPLALTCSAGGTVVDTETARTVRYPIRVPVAATRFRVHIANRNDRDNILYPGALSITGLWLGEAARTGGELTGATVTAPTQLRGAFATPATGEEWVSEWFDQPLSTADHILSLGYTCTAQDNHAGQGGAWVSTVPADASLAAPVVTRVQQAPLDVWIECEIPASVPVIACLGDSLTAGTAATLPVFDSWPLVYGRLQEVWPVHFAHHGSNMAGWAAGDDHRWTKYGPVNYDAVVWALGSNDVFGGASLATVKARFDTLHPKVAALSPRIVLATIMPRNSGTVTPEIEAVRTGYNAWLWQRPGGAVAVVDFAKSIESTLGPDIVRGEYIAGDNVHLNTIGYAQNALAIPGRVAH